MKHTIPVRAKRTIALLLCIILIASLVTPFAVHAEDNQKTIRVGWYESPFNTTDDSGRRSGYAYEYQMKIAAYTGWKYTYVSGSWPELMQMLTEGKIDMMSDVSYTEEREDEMLFSELPMGTEEYCIFVSANNQEITAEDYSTLNGKRIGVNEGSIQIEFYKSWAERHGIEAELTELTCTEQESEMMLQDGSLDAYITLNAYGNPETLVPVCMIGSSDFYFVINKEHPELLADLNTAMNRIRDEDPYYNQQMFEKHVKRYGTNAYLSSSEKEWLTSHGTIRVGYQDDYLPFCAKDEKTGELTGAMKKYLEEASDCIANAHLEFETVAYPNVADALSALKEGEIDCLFPAAISSYDGETQEVLITPELIRTDVYAVVRKNDENIFTEKERVVVAINENDLNFTVFLQDNFPEWNTVYYPGTKDCLQSVSDGIADCMLIGSLRYSSISRLCDQYHLTNYSTEKGMDYCFAVAQDETELYSIISKVVGLVPGSTLNAVLSGYIAEDARTGFWDFLADNKYVVSALTILIMLVFILQLMRLKRSEKKAKELISATETDDLTGLYNRDYFMQYADRMYREHPDTPRDAIVLNIDQFHSINMLNGWEFGDRVLRVLGSETRTIANEFNGIGGRFGADRFDIYCNHIGDHRAFFERMQKKLDTLAPNASVRLRMGVMPWQEKLEPLQLLERAQTACNMARGNSMEHMIVFDEKLREKEMFDQRLLTDLRGSLDNFEFDVYYQPKFDIRSDKPVLAGAEALIRWQHPELGMLTPDKFIPLFERNGKISEVDKYVWAQTAKQIADWRARFGVTITVSVNLSRVDIFDANLESTLDNLLAQEGLKHDAIEIEITESAYTTENADRLIHVTKALHRKGYTIEMDDFGTEYSSLNMLSSMPIDVLKMDKAFIRKMENSKKDTQMVSLILGTADNLGIPVIAEGVETEAQYLMLKKMGCSYVQGYYFSRPLHPSEFEADYLNKNP